MGRLIDAERLREEVYSWGMNDYEPSDFADAIDDAPTVEAIPIADYEARLIVEMLSMLTKLQVDIERHTMTSGVTNQGTWNECIACCNKVIQQKIDRLKENKNENKKN